MIKRFTDETTFSDDLFAKLEKVVSDENAEQTLQVSDSEEQIKQAELEAKIRGMNVTVEKVNDKYHLKTQKQERIKYREAMNSGRFKKLAWGRYCFQRQANEPLGFEKYDFDDGSIWKVIKGEDGKEYLVKEVDDKDEDKVIRNSKLKAAASKKPMFVTETNAKNIVQILYNCNNRFVDDMLKTASNATIKMLNDKLAECIAEKIAENKFISSPKYLSSVTASVESAITDNKIKNMNQLDASIVEFTTKFISDTNS